MIKISIRLFITLFITLFTLIGTTVAYSANSTEVFIPKNGNVQPLNVQLDFLEDTDGTYTIDQIVGGQVGNFRPLITKNYKNTYKKRALWIRFNADFSGYDDLHWYLIQNYEHVAKLTVFYPDAGAHYRSIEFAEDVAPGNRLFNIHNYLFKIPAVNKQAATYYVRYEPDRYTLNVDLSWGSTKGVIENISNTQLGLGLFFGGLLVMLVYNTSLFIYRRDRTYFYYIYYLSAFIATFFYINGFAPLLVQMNITIERFFATCAYASVQGMILYGRHFLNLKTSIRWLDIYLLFFQWILFAGAMLSFVLPPAMTFNAINYLILLVLPFLVLAGAIRCYQGYQPAYLYFSGWVILGTGLALQALRTIDVVPTNFVTSYAIQIASVWEAIIFSLALAIRLRLLEKEDQDKQSKSDFFSVMSHEIRTPMNAILSSVELLQRSRLDHGQKELITVAGDAADGLLNLLDDVLDLSRLDAHRIELEQLPTDIAALAQSAIDLASLKATEKGLPIVLESQLPIDLDVGIDPMRVRQILANLLSNAVKFTEHGSVTVNLRLFSGPPLKTPFSPETSLLEITVLDTGIGIPYAQQARLFNAFTQADSTTTRLYGGSGLGLSICRQLTELMQGTLLLRSEVGIGTTLLFTIPVTTMAREPAPAKTLPLDSGNSVSAISSFMLSMPTVLVVDDHAINRLVIQRQLEALGCHAVLAEDGVTALALLAQRSFSLILLDCFMPGQDGYQVARNIRKGETGETRHLPIIAISAAVDQLHIQRCLDAGMNSVLKKPLRLEDLRQLIEEKIDVDFCIAPEA